MEYADEGEIVRIAIYVEDKCIANTVATFTKEK